MEKTIKSVGNKNLKLEQFFRTRNYNIYYKNALRMGLILMSYLNVDSSSIVKSLNFPKEEEEFSMKDFKDIESKTIVNMKMKLMSEAKRDLLKRFMKSNYYYP